MLTTQDILKFHFSPTTFQQSAQRIIPIKLTSLNEYRIDKLQKITEKVGASSFSFSGNNLIPQVFRKFKSSISNSTIVLERRELRTLSYTLNYSEQGIEYIFGNLNDLNYALKLLELNWRDSFLVGLIDCFLKNWETKHQKSLEQLEQFIAKKMENYTGNRTTLISFKNNKRFFSTKNGDLILGDTIAKQNRPIQDATKILGVPESWFEYPYFSKVIVTYYERNKNDLINKIDSLDEVLGNHKYLISKKRLIPKIVVQATEPNFLSLKDKVKKIALTHLKDPQNKGESLWFTLGDEISETEIRELQKAKDIVSQWMVEEFINVFFNVCINDERRKKFWLRFASKISSFKIYGPLHTKSILKQDERIAEYVDARFETVSSKRDVSAFILYIEDYMLIEFSNEGYAFVAYKINSALKPRLNSQLNSVDDLRNSSMPMAVYTDNYYDYFNDEGRLTHRDGNQIWETRFNSWMNKKVFG